MSLLTMCKRVLGEVGWPVPSTVATNTEATAVQIMAIANAELRALSEAYNWPHLRTVYSFNTVAGQSEYAWPDDFRFVAWDTVFDTDQYYRIRGSMPLARWQNWLHGLYGSISHQRFLQGYDSTGDPVIKFAPAPNTVRGYTAFYYSNQYARDNAGNSQAMYVNDSDVSKIPERLVELGVKWRFRRAKGLDYSAELAEYNSAIPSQYARLAASGDIPVGGTQPSDDGLTSGYVPDNGFG